MPVRYENSPEVAAIARPLIQQYHRHLANVRIEYLFVDPTPKRAGMETWGTARKISSLSAFFAGETEPDGPNAFFAIVISKGVWEHLKEEQRVALVDHELMHCFVDVNDDGSPKLMLLGHDVEDFHQIILRHGIWRDSIQTFADAIAAQNTLFQDANDTPKLRIA